MSGVRHCPSYGIPQRVQYGACPLGPFLASSVTHHRRLFCTVPKGMESLLARELEGLGASEVRPTTAGVACRGDLVTAYRICLWSRVASRVLLALTRFSAPDEQALYHGVQAIDWSQHLVGDGTLAVDANLARSRITHSRFAALRVKDAVVDQFRERTGGRPGVDTDRPMVRINLYIHRDEARLSLDLAGESLHRRGYRDQAREAPLKENLAAAILLLAGWPDIARRGGSLADPMCGSGTLPIEAALMAGDIAPGLLRDYFGFQGWRGHDAVLWEGLLDEARARKAVGLQRIPRLYGFDQDLRAVQAARANAHRAGIAEHLSVEQASLAQLQLPAAAKPGLVVVNPPYGTRLGRASELPALYAELGDCWRRNFAGWRGALFTGRPELARYLGFRWDRSRELFNGALACKLFSYQLKPEQYRAVKLPVDRDRARDLRPSPADRRGPGAEMFANRLRKNRKQLGRWAAQQHIDCYRLYDADLPEYAVAVDLYRGEALWAHVQEYEAPPSVDPDKADERLRDALGVIPEVLDIPPSQVFLKVRQRQRARAQYQRQDSRGEFYRVREGDCAFWVNFTDYLDTGLFLDHRITREMIRELAPGQHFLNLFCYTASATVHAARGGALSTTSVDLSRTYLDWARRNLALNGLDEADHELVQADCRDWLREASADPHRQGRYGLVFLDPPTFSTSKRMQGTWDVQRDHPELINRGVRLLAPGGQLIFSTNARRFRLQQAALKSLKVEDISQATLPRDFARNPRIHRCWRITRG